MTHAWAMPAADSPLSGIVSALMTVMCLRGLLIERAGAAQDLAGAFGACAARLMDYLNEGHFGVKLSDDEVHRITLWLDSNTEFYGGYENVATQSRGEVVWRTLN